MRLLILILLHISLSNVAQAADATMQAESFAQIYSSICLGSINDLAALKEKLKSLPQLPPESASQFLVGNAGSAWPVPDDSGLFVLALPDNKNICSVFARRASAEKAEELFVSLVSNAPAPLLTKKVTDEYTETTSNGKTHTIAYEWYVENANRKLLFMLTTTSYENAEIQVLGTASVVTE